MRKELLIVIVSCAAVASLRLRTARQFPFSRLEELRQILMIAIPRWLSLEMLMVGALAALAVGKVHLLLQTAGGRKCQANFLVTGQRDKFIRGIVDFILWYIPKAMLDSSLSYIGSCLSQRMRSHLQEFTHDSLQQPKGHLCAKALDGADHRATQDLMMFCHNAVFTLLQLLGPSVDIAFLSLRALEDDLSPIIGVFAYLALSVASLTCTPDTSSILSSIQGRESDFRTIHAQIASHAEEVAFYRGEAIERDCCNKRVESIIRKSKQLTRVKGVCDMVESLVTKYCATAFGYLICATPVLAMPDSTEQASAFVLYQQLYTPLTQAVGKLARINQRISSLLSSSFRACTLLTALRGCQTPRPEAWRGSPRICVDDVSVGIPGAATPLLQHITFSVYPGQSILITGPCGVGKSLLVSVLAGITAPITGSVSVPPGVVVCPSRTVLPKGSLRELLTYPLDTSQCLEKGISDDEIREVATSFGLSALTERMDAEQHWEELLSGGERQRVALIRVALHRPTFAVLDDCTNSLTQQDELTFLTYLQRAGVTLVTVSHRSALRSMHHSSLQLDNFSAM